MRFLRGLGLAIVFFFIWVFGSFIGAAEFIGKNGINSGQQFSITSASPFVQFLMIVGFLGMFLFPLYYWIIEPILKKRKPTT